MRNTIAVVLAGGEGKRFFPFTTTKPLIPFISKPILVHTVNALESNGFLQIVIVVSKQNEEKIRKYFKGKKSVKLAVQKTARGMADALLSAENLVKGKSIFVLNATDLVENKVFKLAFENLKSHRPFIIAKKHKEYIDLGYLNYSGKKLVGIVEKPGEGKQPSNLVNLVFRFIGFYSSFKCKSIDI
jgi:NDP-sugar pyrophosphorylase family protein